MLNGSVRGLSVIETRTVLQNMNVHYCCVFFAMNRPRLNAFSGAAACVMCLALAVVRPSALRLRRLPVPMQDVLTLNTDSFFRPMVYAV